MFKVFFNKKSKNRDLRFLDSETYSKRQPTKFRHASDSDDDAFIRVESDGYSAYNAIQEISFLERIKHATSEKTALEETALDETNLDEIIELGLPENPQPKKNVYGFDFEQVSSNDLKQLKGLGVFSDSKIYSALIHSVLSDYHLNIQHFNHPNTFKAKNYEYFDSISVWIVFLSDENDCDFLDLFLDRYVDKPTLFLFSKLNKDASIKRIHQFIQQHNLHKAISDTLLHEIEDIE